MKKVKLLVVICGTPEGVPGDVVEVTEKEAQAFVEAGYAELVEEPKKKAKE